MDDSSLLPDKLTRDMLMYRAKGTLDSGFVRNESIDRTIDSTKYKK
jgi:hypothetical protein